MSTPESTDEISVSRHVLRHLGARDAGDVHSLDAHLPRYHLLDAILGFEEHFPACGLRVELRGTGGLKAKTPAGPTIHDLLNAGYKRFGTLGERTLRCAPGRARPVPTSCIWLVSEGEHAGVFWIVDGGYTVFVWGAVRCGRESEAWGRGLLERLRQRVREASVFRGHTCRPVAINVHHMDLAFVDGGARPPVQVAAPLQHELEHAFLDFRLNRELLARHGIRVRRGLMLAGEPGTGKTSTCRYLKQRLPDHTFFLVSAKLYGLLEGVFKTAARLAPAVVVIEDVDLIARSREAQGPSWVMGDLLNLLDGLEDRDDVSVVVTSNSWKFLERALVDRPGRIDHVITYGLPDAGERGRLLEALAGKVELPPEREPLIELTDGLTPAQIEEVVDRAAVASLAREGAAAWSRRVTAGDVRLAVEALRGRTSTARPRRISL